MLAELQLKSDKTLFERFLLCQHVMMSPVFTHQLSGLLECGVSESPASWQSGGLQGRPRKVKPRPGARHDGEAGGSACFQARGLEFNRQGSKSEHKLLTYMCVRGHLDLSIIGVGETLGARISFTPQ